MIMQLFLSDTGRGTHWRRGTESKTIVNCSLAFGVVVFVDLDKKKNEIGELAAKTVPKP
jgi:hypothetical protein